jgi:hypothetical protein
VVSFSLVVEMAQVGSYLHNTGRNFSGDKHVSSRCIQNVLQEREWFLASKERELQYILSSENVYVLCAGITYKLPLAKIERYFYFYLTG